MGHAHFPRGHLPPGSNRRLLLTGPCFPTLTPDKESRLQNWSTPQRPDSLWEEGALSAQVVTSQPASRGSKLAPPRTRASLGVTQDSSPALTLPHGGGGWPGTLLPHPTSPQEGMKTQQQVCQEKPPFAPHTSEPHHHSWTKQACQWATGWRRSPPLTSTASRPAPAVFAKWRAPLHTQLLPPRGQSRPLAAALLPEPWGRTRPHCWAENLEHQAVLLLEKLQATHPTRTPSRQRRLKPFSAPEHIQPG